MWCCVLRGKSIRSGRYQVIAQPGAILLTVERFFHTTHVPLKGLKHITVLIGPGTFSFLRAGVVVANTLAAVLRVPIRGVRATHDTDSVPLSKLTRSARSRRPLRPWYGRAPSITIRK